MICGVMPMGLRYLRHERQFDERGSFGRLWCADDFKRAGLDFKPVQASLSVTAVAGTLRGMHWQAAPFAETKVLQVIRGRIFDAVVRLDPVMGMPRLVMRELGPGEGFFIPAGLAHGFLTLTDDVELIYMMDRPYEPTAVCGARYDDPALAIPWPQEPRIIADKDRHWPLLPR
jgi:dTDP-4-dehydrorhamnose 3,5-epimerase